MKIQNNPQIFYLEDQCYSWTFDAKKVKKIVECHCKGRILNLFAGKNRLSVKETRVDVSDEFKPDFNMNAEDYLKFAFLFGLIFDVIIYDPPWNERKSKEFYNGNYIGKFTKLKDNIVKILSEKGIIISVGYEISNFGKKRLMEVKKVYTVNPFGEIRPYFISIEKKVCLPNIRKFL